MTCAVFALLLTFIATLGELLLNSFGLSLPLLGLVCFYLAVAYGFWTGAGVAVLGGASIDFLLGREHPMSIVLLLLVVALAMLWLHKLEAPSSPLLLSFPGAALPFILWVPWSLPEWEASRAWFVSFFECLAGGIVASACAAALMPLAVLALDYFGQKLGLPLFVDAKDRLAVK